MEQSSMESMSFKSLTSTQFDRSSDKTTSIDSFESLMARPVVKLRIYCNISSKNTSGDSSILLYDRPELRKEISIFAPSAIFLNAKKSKTKIIQMATIPDLSQKKKELSQYKLLGIIDQYYDASKKACFDLKSSPESLLLERDLIKGTFVNLRERGFNRMPLRSQDIIKLGRQILRVTIVEDRVCPSFRWVKDLKQQSERIEGNCRICLCSESYDSQETDIIVSPCACSGSCGHVHIQCLRKWLETRMIIYKNERVTSLNLDVFHCQVCKADLPKYMKVQEEIVELFPCMIESEGFVMLERVCEKNSVAYIVPYREGEPICISMGRHETNDLILDDMSISRRHATLHIEERGEIYISDNNSKFGTFVELQRDLYNLQEVNLLSDRFTFSFEVNH